MSLVFWHWWILAGLLLVGEMLTFTSFLLWTALAAGITGLFKWIYPLMHWEWQFTIFAVISIIGIVISILFLKKEAKEDKSGDSALNNRSKFYIGKQYTLITPIVNGSGRAKVGDSEWLVQCDVDLPEKSRVKVISAKGTVLIVEPIKKT